MNKLFTIAFASALGLGMFSVNAADSAAEERSELRQRADTYQAERARNPDYQPGVGRLNAKPADVQPKRARSEARLVKNKSAKAAPKETRRAKAAKRVRSLKKIPGAFVR